MNRLVALVLLAAPTVYAQAHRIGVDPRIELMSIIFRLSGAGEYSQGRVPAYIAAIDKHFEPVRNHAVVSLAKELRAEDGVSYDAVMSMAVNIKDARTLAERIPFDSPNLKLDARWKGPKARKFLAAARQFVADSKYEEFLKAQQPLFEKTDATLRTFVDTQADLKWFDKFFGARPGARFIIVPGLVNGGASYGASLIAEDGVEEIYAIPGVSEIDANGQPVFARSYLETLVHEFVHSYTNPLVNKYVDRMEKAGEAINKPLFEEMKAQGYGNARTLLYESMVRASVIRYTIDHDGEERARHDIEAQRARSFVWIGDLAHLLGKYSQDRVRYPTLDVFMPQVAELFDGIARTIDARIQAYEAERPKVVSMNIKNGATEVDSGLPEITIKFDRPMRKTTYAVARITRDRHPKTGNVSYDEAGTTFRIPVTLEPDHAYEFSLNWPGGGSFASAEGVLLKNYVIRFRTAPAK